MSCNANNHPKDHERLTTALADAGPDSSAKWAPWWRHPDPTPRTRTSDADSLRILIDTTRRSRLVEEVVAGIRPLWTRLRDDAF